MAQQQQQQEQEQEQDLLSVGYVQLLFKAPEGWREEAKQQGPTAQAACPGPQELPDQYVLSFKVRKEGGVAGFLELRRR